VPVCLCTLAIHAPYRQRARLLCSDASAAAWIVVTDQPQDFADLPVRAIQHGPTGPMAADYLAQLAPTGNGRGAAAYHDKRFAIQAALRDFETAVFLDADSRIAALPPLEGFPRGLAVLPVVRASIADHLARCGSWRLPAFTELAVHLMGDPDVLHAARWCHETCYAVTRDGNEGRFLAAWAQAAEFLRQRDIYSGEGGVMGLAAAYAGWSVDYDALAALSSSVSHEGGGPKGA
jgi:hypothetical protein